MRPIILLVAWAAVSTSNLQAGTNVWTALGPGGGPVTTLAINPQRPGILYAATNAGLFQSSNQGADWGAVNPGPPCCIAAMVLHPQDPDILYAVTRTGVVLKSTDGGTHWNPMSAGLPVDGGGNYGVTSLAVDPENPTTLYAGNALNGSDGVFKTTDGGGSWVPVSSGLPDGGVTALAVDPQTAGVVYASTRKSGVFKSNDGGASWSAVNAGLDADSIHGYNYISLLAINPRDPNTI